MFNHLSFALNEGKLPTVASCQVKAVVPVKDGHAPVEAVVRIVEPDFVQRQFGPSWINQGASLTLFV